MAETARKKLAIIDGKSVFYRGYYAMPNLSTADGTPTGGVYGFSAMALELIKRLKPDYVCVAWDKPKTNIRKRLEIYPGYKAGRKPAPPDFYIQIPILHEVLRAFNWPLYELDDYEADDIMASMAKKADAAGLETMLISSDLDMLQAVGKHTHMYALKKGFSNIERFDVGAFEAKYGINVEQFLDLKSLKGDGSDNIPGVPGVGEKTALDLLKQYKTLDNIYENLDLLKESVRKKLEAGKESALMSKEVARLYIDAPIELDLEQMDVNKLDTAELAAILKRLEFRSLLRNLPSGMQMGSDEQRTKNEGNTAQSNSSAVAQSSVDSLLPKLHLINNNKDLSRIELDGDVVAYGRCSGKHGKNPTLLVLADEQNAYALDLRAFGFQSSAFSLPEGLTGYDLKSVFKLLLELGYDELPVVTHDVQIGAFLVSSIRRDYSLTTLASTDLGYNSELDNIDDDQALERAAEICAVIRALAVMQGEQMSEVTSLIKLADKVEWPVIPVLARMERAGVKIDPKFFGKFSENLADKIIDIEQTIYGYADQEFNISSPTQLSEILFTKLSLPTNVTKKGKAGHFSTASDVLGKLRELHPIIDCIEQYREFTKLKGTYVDTLPKMVDKNGRLHTTFHMTVAPTGRLSSQDPNLQNIPIRTELGRELRQGFIAEKGNVLVSGDYSQFELRVAAAMSGDEGMIDSFNSDRDVHTETAALVAGIDSKDVTKAQRYAAKAVNFGILYGQGTHGLSEGTGMSYAEAKAFIAKYFEVRPKLRGMIDNFRDMALKKGYVETILGRRKPTPDVQSSNFMVREGAYRAAINMPIQGGAADLTKMAMIKLQEQFDQNEERRTKNEDRTSKINSRSPFTVQRSESAVPRQILQIHDSILVECLEKDTDNVGKMMKQTMENIYPELGVKLKVDISTGKTWGEL
ncbi:MAG: DNA polymerase I [bacterium]|nr:DNA polymerase I [bacterium]